MENITEISRIMYGNALQLNTVAQARDLLANSRQFRGLGDVLKSFTGCGKTKEIIVDALLSYDPSKSREAVDRKVRNWLNGTTATLEKRTVYHLCRALDLSVEQTDAMLKYITGEGIHWRDPEEIIWCYAVANRLDYPAVCRLLEAGTVPVRRAGKVPAPAPGSFTEDVRQDVFSLLNQPEGVLLDYLTGHRDSLGAYHNTAYELFMEYNQILEGAGSPEKIAVDGKVTSRYIVEHYLCRRVLPTARRGDRFSAVQRSIRMNWPDEATYSKMKSRELDVSRKVMMLLFLAVDDGEPEEKIPDPEDYDAYDLPDEMAEDAPLTRDERFELLQDRMNRMLHSCGFQPLDPRSPFDWIILFCMCAEDMIELDRRLEQTLAMMFPDGSEKQSPAPASDIL